MSTCNDCLKDIMCTIIDNLYDLYQENSLDAVHFAEALEQIDEIFNETDQEEDKYDDFNYIKGGNA